MRSKFRLFLTAAVAVACIIALSSPGVAGALTIGPMHNDTLPFPPIDAPHKPAPAEPAPAEPAPAETVYV